MHEQKGRDESVDLSLVRSFNNATRVLVGQKSHQTFSWGEAPQKPWLNLAQSSVRDTVAELLSIKNGIYF